MCEKTEEVLFYKQPILFSCDICGNHDDMNGYDKDSPIVKTMQQRHVCYDCAYWLNLLKQLPINYEIIGHVLYVANPFVHRPWQVIKGHFGKEFYIRKHNGMLLRVNNLWNLGKIPERFYDQLPDTANFLSLMTYQRLSKDAHKCNAKGCWDRYHCLRYDHENEKDGPFNIVPSSHRIGDEQCPSFVNINELKI